MTVNVLSYVAALEADWNGGEVFHYSIGWGTNYHELAPKSTRLWTAMTSSNLKGLPAPIFQHTRERINGRNISRKQKWHNGRYAADFRVLLGLIEWPKGTKFPLLWLKQWQNNHKGIWYFQHHSDNFFWGESWTHWVIKGAQYLLNIHQVLVAMGFFPAGVQDETLKEDSPGNPWNFHTYHTLLADSAIFRKALC